MVIPISFPSTEKASFIRPRDQREAALSLGATRGDTVESVVPCPSGHFWCNVSGLLGPSAETMAVNMVIAIPPWSALSPFSRHSIAAANANEVQTKPRRQLHTQSLCFIELVWCSSSLYLHHQRLCALLNRHTSRRAAGWATYEPSSSLRNL